MASASRLKVATYSAILGAVVPLVIYTLQVAFPSYPPNVWSPAWSLCPPSILFLLTVLCGPWSACALKVLAAVVFINALLYAIVAATVHFAVSRVVALIRRRAA